MKPTQKAIEREAKRLYEVAHEGRYPDSDFMSNGSWRYECVHQLYVRLSRHVLRRIAAARKRGFTDGILNERLNGENFWRTLHKSQLTKKKGTK